MSTKLCSKENVGKEIKHGRFGPSAFGPFLVLGIIACREEY